MIISRTPFRLSFFGGITDYPQWYRDNGGTVVSTTIDKYCTILVRHLPPFFPYKHILRYSKRQEVSLGELIDHPSIRCCFDFTDMNDKGLEVVHTADIPAMSGVGSSSAFTVGLLHALYGLQGKIIAKRRLASDAIYVEQDLIKEAVGSQDQVACAFGGFNKIEFGENPEFQVKPLTFKAGKLRFLEKHLMLFFTGFSRYASDIAEDKIKNLRFKNGTLKCIQDMVDQAINIISGDSEGNLICEFGNLLDESWRLKRSISDKISTDDIDAIYNLALRLGAIGGKLLGAGGGGFLLLFVEPQYQEKVKAGLRKLVHVPFKFESLGSQIIHYSEQEVF